ncbi:MAG: TIM barrel protein [Acidobacteriota bacterium]
MLWTVFRNLPFEERIEKVASAGYRAVELGDEFSGWSKEDFRRMNSKRRSLEMTFNTITGSERSLVDPSEREAFLADIRNSLKIAERLECPTMIVLSGNTISGMTREAQHESIVEGLKWAAKVVEGKGVTVLLENIDLEENPNYFLWSVLEGLQIIGEVNHPQIKFLYDFFHAQISGGNLIANLQKGIAHVGGVHIADVPGRHEPGTGEINYSSIYKKLAELRFAGYVAMEYLPTLEPVKSLRIARDEALQAAQTVRK